MDDTQPHLFATGPDLPRRTATSGDTDYTLAIDEVSEIYARAGHARTTRTLQRYCVTGHLDAQKVATTLGDKYFVTPQSVARHIEQIRELNALDKVATGRDQPRFVATHVATEVSHAERPTPSATDPDQSRQGAAGRTQSREVAPGDQHVSPELGVSGPTIQDDGEEARRSAARNGPTDLAVYEHPYVKRLEDRVEKLEAKYEAQVRRTEDIQTKSQEQLIELQRMTAVSNSTTLADFMLKARNWVLGPTIDNENPEPKEHNAV